MAYGRDSAHQICQFHLLMEYRCKVDWDEAIELLISEDLSEVRKLVARIVKLTGG